MAELLGLGVFGVIIDCDRDNFRTQRKYLKVPPVKHSITALRELAENRFRESNLILFESADKELSYRIDDWMLKHDFYHATGINPGRLLIRNGAQEVAISIRAFNVNIFVHSDIPQLKLLDLQPRRPILIFGATSAQIRIHRTFCLMHNHVSDWHSLLETIK